MMAVQIPTAVFIAAITFLQLPTVLLLPVSESI
jgi:hypothetical protein